MSESKTYQAKCFCGTVRFTVTGEPEAMAYCHCDSCRHWSASLVNAFTLWKPETLRITQGGDEIAEYEKNPATGDPAVHSRRKWCRRCGGHLFVEHPAMGVVDVPAALITGLTYDPAFHVHYQETVHPMRDALPRFKDLPGEAGGSGETVPTT